MAERDDYGGDAPFPAKSGPALEPQPPRSAAEQAGPATWADTVPAGGSQTGQPKPVVERATEKASEIAREAGQEVEEVAGRKKAEAAERLGRIARALREAARALPQGEAGSLPRYVESAAERLERASGHLRDRDLRSIAREVEHMARQRPEVFLAGSVLTGIALARFLKSSSRRRRPAYEPQMMRDETMGEF